MEIFDPAYAGRPKIIPGLQLQHASYKILGAGVETALYPTCSIIRQTMSFDALEFRYDVILVKEPVLLRLQVDNPIYLLNFILGNSFTAIVKPKGKKELRQGQVLFLHLLTGQLDAPLAKGEYRFIQLISREDFLRRFVTGDLHQLEGVSIAISLKAKELLERILHTTLEGLQARISIELAARELQLEVLRQIQQWVMDAGIVSLGEQRRMEEVKAYILEHLENKISANQICDHFKISRTRLYVGFRAANKITLRDYILEQKMERGKQLLKNGLPVGDVARIMGYPDTSNFIRAFKKLTGTTPYRFQSDKSGTN